MKDSEAAHEVTSAHIPPSLAPTWRVENDLCHAMPCLFSSLPLRLVGVDSVYIRSNDGATPWRRWLQTTWQAETNATSTTWAVVFQDQSWGDKPSC